MASCSFSVVYYKRILFFQCQPRQLLLFQLPQVCGYSNSKELPESVFDLHGVHGLFLKRCIEIEPKPKFDESVSDLQSKLGKKWKNVLKSISPWATHIACQGCMTSYTMRTSNLWKFLARYIITKLWIKCKYPNYYKTRQW